MKRWTAILLIFLVIIMGCTKVRFVCPDGSLVESKSECKIAEEEPEEPEPQIEPEEEVKEEVEEVVEEIVKEVKEEPKEGTYNLPFEIELKENEEILVDNKVIRLARLDHDGEFDFYIDGITRTVYNTRVTEIINGLEITPKKIIINSDRESTLLVHFSKYEANPEEYLLQIDESVSVNGVRLTLKKVRFDNTLVKVITDEKGPTIEATLMPGKTVKFGSLMITNIKSFGKDRPYESYAILKIVAAK